MKTQLSKPARTKARYTEEYKHEALELWGARKRCKAQSFFLAFVVRCEGGPMGSRLHFTQMSESLPGQVAEPGFSPEGFYYTACAYNYTFNVTISTTTSGARIRWTTDGNNWTDMANGGMASFVVVSLHTATLQAYAYKSGMTNSNVHSDDYSYERDCGGAFPLDLAFPPPPTGPMAPDVSSVTYTLDKAGNRTSVNSTGYSPNSINQYTSVGGSPVTNGNDHEINAYGGFTFTYMRDQELTKVTAPSVPGFSYDLAYDALGRCVRRIINNDPAYTTWYIYDGEKPILEYNANGGLVGFNVYGKGVDEILKRGANGTDNQWHWYYFQQDHEGSVTHLTDYSGAILERYRYDAFGAPTIYAPNWTVRTGSSYNNRFLFTGREYDGAWVYEYRARLYHSGIGRFMSEDPKGFVHRISLGTAPPDWSFSAHPEEAELNLFRYCHNDPINFTDPMGLEEVEIEFRAFIQQANMAGYRGDNRGFSSERAASSRVAVRFKVETDPGKNRGNPLIGKPEIKVGMTHQNLTGIEKTSTGPKMPQVTATQDKSGNVTANVQMKMENPLDRAGSIKANVNITVNQDASNVSAKGTVSAAPAFEANFTPQNGPTTNLPLQLAPQSTTSFISGVLFQTNDIEGSRHLPPKLDQ